METSSSLDDERSVPALPLGPVLRSASPRKQSPADRPAHHHSRRRSEWKAETPWTEVAQILWVLSEAAELADTADTLSTLALIEEALRMVRDRFDRRHSE